MDGSVLKTERKNKLKKGGYCFKRGKILLDSDLR